MAPTTICLINQKGGCGKSSTCFHLAGALVNEGLQVLLIDADPQGSLSQGFFGPEHVEQLFPDQTTAALFEEDSFRFPTSELIQTTVFDGIFVCPANQRLAPFNTPSPERDGVSQFALREFIEDKPAFDIVLIDCPPNLYRCSWAAMVAADWVIIPVPPEDFGTQGLRAVHQAIQNARLLNPPLRRLGHLVTRYDCRLIVHRSYEQRLRDLYGELVLETVIPEASAFKVALACRKPVEFCSRRSKAAVLTRALAREILDRIAMKNAQRHVA
ncbi:MAG: ParA family protein [Planctomycetota bacterium]|nr:MAG: ParA family protein [Planctomycetota bacterium]